MRKSTSPIEPVIKVREVPLAPEQAFELFTERLRQWWPLASHSIGGESTHDVLVDGRVGGRIIETAADGTEHSWADIIAWDPPHRFVMAWHPNPAPVAASIVEVRFEPTASGCRLHLEHRGWDEFGAELGAATREQYEPGWDQVLDPYLAAANG